MLDEWRDCLRQALAVSSIGRRVVLLINRPPAPDAGEGELGAGELLQQVPAAAQCLDHRAHHAGVICALADLRILIQQAAGDECHLARRVVLNRVMVLASALRVMPHPVFRDGCPITQPDALVTHDVLEQPLQRADATQTADYSAVETDTHHARPSFDSQAV